MYLTRRELGNGKREKPQEQEACREALGNFTYENHIR